MATKQKNHKKNRRRLRPNNLSKRLAGRRLPESRAGEALAVAWGVSVTMLAFCNLANIGVHYYASNHPDAMQMAVLGELLLFFGTVAGGISLVLLLILYRVRRVMPPRGVAVFGVCLAVAPILALGMQTLR